MSKLKNIVIRLKSPKWNSLVYSSIKSHSGHIYPEGNSKTIWAIVPEGEIESLKNCCSCYVDDFLVSVKTGTTS